MNEYRSTLSDTEILKKTVRGPADEKGRIKLQYRFADPDNVVSSEAIVAEEIKGGVLVKWCDAIRAEDERRMQEADAQKKRDFTPEAVEKRTRPTTLPDDPLDMINDKIAALQGQVDNLEANLRELRDNLKTAKDNLKKWEKTREALGGSDALKYDDMPTG